MKHRQPETAAESGGRCPRQPRPRLQMRMLIQNQSGQFPQFARFLSRIGTLGILASVAIGCQAPKHTKNIVFVKANMNWARTVQETVAEVLQSQLPNDAEGTYELVPASLLDYQVGTVLRRSSNYFSVADNLSCLISTNQVTYRANTNFVVLMTTNNLSGGLKVPVDSSASAHVGASVDAGGYFLLAYTNLSVGYTGEGFLSDKLKQGDCAKRLRERGKQEWWIVSAVVTGTERIGRTSGHSIHGDFDVKEVELWLNKGSSDRFESARDGNCFYLLQNVAGLQKLYATPQKKRPSAKIIVFNGIRFEIRQKH